MHPHGMKFYVILAAVACLPHYGFAQTSLTTSLHWETDRKAPQCQQALLNGWWQFQPLYEKDSSATVPAQYGAQILVPSFWNSLPKDLGGDWDAYRNFNWPDEWNKAQAAGYRRTFTLPAREAGKVLRIHFDAVLADADVFVNGSKVLSIDDGFLPFEADITGAVKWDSQNTLELIVRQQPQKNGEFMRPSGSWVGWNLRGIWQDCSLRLEPEIRLADVFVHPYWKQRTISIQYEIENQSATTQTISILYSVKKSDSGFSPLLPFPPGKTQRQFIFPFRDAKPWSPEKPNLYEIGLVARAEGNPRPLDTRVVRFGFKEFWHEGTNYMLNGQPIRFRGDSWHYMGAAEQSPEYARQWFTMLKSIGGNCVRLHAMPHPPFFLDLADEMGVCILDETAVYGSGGNLALKDDAFWNSARAHAKRLALRDRNHPSVCQYSAANEIVWRGGEESFRKLASLENAIHEVDPTRPVSFDENESDLGGLAHVLAGHYGTVADWDTKWKRDKPLQVNEFSCLYYAGPEEPSKWGGEACFGNFDSRNLGAGAEVYEMILGLRAMGAASITPWNFVWYGLWPAFPEVPVTLNPDPQTSGIKTQRIGEHSVSLNYDVAPGKPLVPEEARWKSNFAFDVMKAAYAPVAAYLRERNTDFYADSALPRHVDVYNDRESSASVRVQLKLGDLAHEDEEVELGPYEHKLVAITPEIAEVDHALTTPLTVRTYKGNSALHEEKLDCWVVPRRAVFSEEPPVTSPVTLIGESTPTVQLLQAMGCTVRQGNLGNPESLNGVVLAAPYSLREYKLTDVSTRLSQSGFFARGGKLIALEGSFASDSDSPLARVDRGYTRAWRRGSAEFWHTIPSDDALRYWSQDGNKVYWNGPVAKQVFRKPTRGAFVPLAEVGDGAEGMEFSPLLWFPVERGGVYLNGFELIANAAKHPAAGMILRQMLAMTPNPSPQESGLTIAFGQHLAQWKQLTASIGVTTSTNLVQFTEVQVPMIKQQLEAGRTVMLCDLTTQSFQFDPQWAGSKFQLTRVSVENVAKDYGVSAVEPLLDGISNDDLCWVRRGQSEPVCQLGIQWEGKAPMRSLVTTTPTRWAGFAESAEQFKYAMMLRRLMSFGLQHTLLAETRADAGRVIFCQLDLAGAAKFQPKARRIWSQLLRNAGAEFDLSASPLFDRKAAFVDENGNIRKWLVLGSFSAPDYRAALDKSFIDEASAKPVDKAETAGHTWHVASATDGFVDLKSALGGQPQENAAAYMAIYVDSPVARDVLLDTPDMVDLAIGADDGVKAWLNGEVLITKDRFGPYTPDEFRAKGVKLHKGSNLLLLKVSQKAGDWRGGARFMTTHGATVQDLTYSTSPP